MVLPSANAKGELVAEAEGRAVISEGPQLEADSMPQSGPRQSWKSPVGVSLGIPLPPIFRSLRISGLEEICELIYVAQ